MNFEQDLICPECCNPQLLGLNFNEESIDINNFIELYSYCILNHKRDIVSLQKNNFNYIFSDKKKNSIIYDKELKCESCNKKPFEYHCFECKRNICQKCFEYHKTHRYYYNYGYISERELEEINNNFENAKKYTDLNIMLIESQIIKYEMQLNNLKQLFKRYKDINDKLKSFSKYILDKYTELLKLQKPIYYPIYFNMKNILSFSSIPINLPKEDISINSFTNILTKKIISGCYFIISNSSLTTTLEDYNKPNQFKTYFNIKSIDDFTKKEIIYDSIFPYGENKFCGLNYYFPEINGNDQNKKKEEGVDIYNIKTQMVETKIKSTPENIYCNEKYNIIIFVYEDYLEIYNSKDFSLIQEIIYDETRKRIKRHNTTLWNPNISTSFHDFSDVEFISENTIGFLYEGNLAYLGDEVESLFVYDKVKVINVSDDEFDSCSDDYCYFIVYKRENKNAPFIPKSVSLLVKRDIKISEISLKLVEDERNFDDNSYCYFEPDGITKLSDEGYIFSFKSRIQEGRDQEGYYITETFYKNETIYYFLNCKEDKYIKNIIGRTKEKSFLFKNDLDEKFYFLYNQSDDVAESMKVYFEKCGLNLIKINAHDKLNIRDIFIENHNVIGWNHNSIFVGKIIFGELEIIHNFNLPNNEFGMYMSLKNKCFYYKNSDNQINEYDSVIEDD